MTEEKLRSAPILFDLDEVATIAGVTRRTLYNHIKSGSLKAFKVCNKWKVSKEDLNAFLYRGR